MLVEEDCSVGGTFSDLLVTKVKHNPNRRKFLTSLTATASAVTGVAAMFLPSITIEAPAKEASNNGKGDMRSFQCAKVRRSAASAIARTEVPPNRSNGDEQLYPSRIGSYHKGPPHNDIGEVDLRAYRGVVLL